MYFSQNRDPCIHGSLNSCCVHHSSFCCNCTCDSHRKREKKSKDTADKHSPTCAHPQQGHTRTRSEAEILCAVPGCRSNQSARVWMGIISYRVSNPGDSCLVTGGGELGWGAMAGQLCCVCVRERGCLEVYCTIPSPKPLHTHTHTWAHASLHLVYGSCDVTW